MSPHAPRSIPSLASRPSGGRSASPPPPAFSPFARSPPGGGATPPAPARAARVPFRALRAANKPAHREGGPPRGGSRADPLAALAEVAGHGDRERWWEDVVESRREG